MMEQLQQTGEPADKKVKSHDWRMVLGIVLVAVIVATISAVVVVKFVFFPSAFKPVTLSAKEENALSEKIQRLNAAYPQSRDAKTKHAASDGKPALTPEGYTEETAKREIAFTEKEFNALIAKNTDLADKLAIDFSGDMASMKLLVPMDPDFPFLGGKTLKVTAGVELAYRAGKPVVKIRGVGLWGVPVPNAWMGNLKNVDLVHAFGGEKGFWHTFAEGVEEIAVEEDCLRIKLKP